MLFERVIRMSKMDLSFLPDLMEEKSVPGVVVGLLHAGEIQIAAVGVTNLDHPLPVTEDTLFQIGSITKTFTGTAVMRLVEMGKLDLNARIRDYLPEFQVRDGAAAANATIAHLLTHTAGWVGDYFDDTGPGRDALPKYVTNMADLEQLAPLGSLWSYNNAGFIVAGLVIEKVTCKPYEQALQELVLEPLGLEHSFFDPGDVMTYRFAVGHNQFGSNDLQVARPWPLPRSAYPAGGITCSAGDLLRYAQFHLGDGQTEDGTQVLAAESLAQMQQPQVTVWGEEKWGLTWSVDDSVGVRLVSHGGGTTGQVSLLTLIPSQQLAILVFTNGNRGGEITQAVTKHLLKAYAEVDVPEPAAIDAPAEQLAAFAGCYIGGFDDIDLAFEDNRLMGSVTYKQGFPDKDMPPPPSPPPMPLGLCELDRLLVMEGPLKNAQVDVLRRDDGTIGWVRISGRIHDKVE